MFTISYILSLSQTSSKCYYKSIINERKYKVVVGDLIEDINMIGRYQENRVLKIGFLNSNIEKNKEIYKEKFDIVLSGKNDFADIQEYLKEIL